MSSSTVSFDVAAYFQFVSQLQLSSVALIQSSAKIDRDAYLAETDTLNSISNTFEDPEVSEAGFSADCKLVLRISAAQTEKQILEISSDFRVRFTTKAQPDETFLKRFINTEARLMTWPYFREFVSNLTARMDIAPITLPMIMRGQDSKPKSTRSKRAASSKKA